MGTSLNAVSYTHLILYLNSVCGLGVNIDTKLLFTNHVDIITSKTRREVRIACVVESSANTILRLH